MTLAHFTVGQGHFITTDAVYAPGLHGTMYISLKVLTALVLGTLLYAGAVYALITR